MELRDKLEKVKENISNTQNKTGLYNKVEIIAVTKTRSFKIIQDSYKAGFLSIGENRVQEALDKFGSFDSMPELKRRFIGHLQSNKLKKCLSLFDTIDSVDSYRLAEKISKTASILSKKQRILIQINTSGEKTKGGFKPEDKNEIVKCFNLPNIKIEGLMTMGPLTNKKEETKKAFTLLNTMFLDINKNVLQTQKMTTLSMGMSGDFLLGVSCGSTMVRVGTGIFGERSYVA